MNIATTTAVIAASSTSQHIPMSVTDILIMESLFVFMLFGMLVGLAVARQSDGLHKEYVEMGLVGCFTSTILWCLLFMIGFIFLA